MGRDGETSSAAPRTGPKRRWVAPAISSTRSAFEHAILSCTGVPPGGSCANPDDFRAKGGTCQTVCGSS